MGFTKFNEMYEKLTYRHKEFIRKLIAQLGEPYKLEERLGENLKDIREKKKIKYKDMVDDSYGKEETMNSIRQVVSRKSKNSEHIGMIAKNLEMEESELLYGENYISKLSAHSFEIKSLYNALDEKCKSAVDTLTLNLVIEDTCPEYFERDEYDYGDMKNE